MNCKHYKTDSCPVITCKIYEKPENCYLAKKTESLAEAGIRSSPSELINIILDVMNQNEKEIIYGAEGLN